MLLFLSCQESAKSVQQEPNPPPQLVHSVYLNLKPDITSAEEQALETEGSFPTVCKGFARLIIPFR